MTLEDLFQLAPYSLNAVEKEAALSDILSKRTRYHYAHCPEYRAILDKLGYQPETRNSKLETLPFIPVRLFKTFELRSVPKEKIVKTLTSSGQDMIQKIRMRI